jgi:hypothetical protein
MRGPIRWPIVSSFSVVLFLGCSAPRAREDANVCPELAESACNAQVGCYAEYSTNTEAGQTGGQFLSCAAGSATCKIAAGCFYSGAGCPNDLMLSFVYDNGPNCGVGGPLYCVQPDKCSP